MSTSTSATWFRHRFHANADDYRPMTFPPPGPYWCTGYAGDQSYAVIVAYLPDGISPDRDDLWPEATNIDTEVVFGDIEFTDRFAEPSWWADHPNNPNRHIKGE